MINRFCIVRRNQDGRSPLKAVAQFFAAPAHGSVGIDADALHLLRLAVVARDGASIVSRVDDVWIRRIGRGESRLAAADALPVAKLDTRRGKTVTGPGGCAQVLHRARDVIR